MPIKIDWARAVTEKRERKSVKFSYNQNETLGLKLSDSYIELAFIVFP